MFMNFINKIVNRSKDPNRYELPTIAFLGDSVTQGCFELYVNNENFVKTIFEQRYTYVNCVKHILEILFPQTPINFINAGISGGHAWQGYDRLQKDVLSFRSDLTIVCFGLNDCNQGVNGLAQYKLSLENIFKTLLENGSEVIFMTANMMNTEVSCHIKDEKIEEIAKGTAILQNNGILETYFNEGKIIAEKYGIKVCDVYKKWKAMNACGVDTTNLLSNYINHPNRQLHWLFAYSLVECMFS